MNPGERSLAAVAGSAAGDGIFKQPARFARKKCAPLWRKTPHRAWRWSGAGL